LYQSKKVFKVKKKKKKKKKCNIWYATMMMMTCINDYHVLLVFFSLHILTIFAQKVKREKENERKKVIPIEAYLSLRIRVVCHSRVTNLIYIYI